MSINENGDVIKVYGVTLRAPAITTRQVNNMADKTRKRIGLIITNSQRMYIFDISLFLQYLTPVEHICLSFLVV